MQNMGITGQTDKALSGNRLGGSSDPRTPIWPNMPSVPYPFDLSTTKAERLFARAFCMATPRVELQTAACFSVLRRVVQ
jgi:hypothetical protein